jgi:hypothetical protein
VTLCRAMWAMFWSSHNSSVISTTQLSYHECMTSGLPSGDRIGTWRSVFEVPLRWASGAARSA